MEPVLQPSKQQISKSKAKDSIWNSLKQSLTEAIHSIKQRGQELVQKISEQIRQIQISRKRERESEKKQQVNKGSSSNKILKNFDPKKVHKAKNRGAKAHKAMGNHHAQRIREMENYIKKSALHDRKVQQERHHHGDSPDWQ